MPFLQRQRRRISGFTLIELMIVVAVIGILATIAIPKFADMLRKSKEGATKGNLDTLRSALAVYYSDLEGQYPSDPQALANNSPYHGQYLSVMPTAKIPDYHPDSTIIFGIETPSFSLFFGGFETFGNSGWVYATTGGPSGDWEGDPASNVNFYVACTHTDTKGTVWTDY